MLFLINVYLKPHRQKKLLEVIWDHELARKKKEKVPGHVAGGAIPVWRRGRSKQDFFFLGGGEGCKLSSC